MEMLNYKQLSDRFPICNNCISSEEAWSLILKRWRDDGKLVERKHWRYGPGVDASTRLTRYYDPRRVVRLCVLENQGQRPRPRIAYLCQTYTEAFIEILKQSVTVVDTDDKQATPS